MPARDFTPDPDRYAKQLRFLHELARGARPPAAAQRAGVSLDAVYTWRRRNASFRQAWKKARDQARATLYPLPPKPKPALAPSAAPPAERLHVVIRSFSPDVPDRHLMMETGPDGRRTNKEWDEYPSREELLSRGEDPNAWEAGRKVWEAGKAKEAEDPRRDDDGEPAGV